MGTKFKNIAIIVLTLFGALIVSAIVSFYTSFVCLQRDVGWIKADMLMQDPVPNETCRERYEDSKERIRDHRDKEHD